MQKKKFSMYILMIFLLLSVLAGCGKDDVNASAAKRALAKGRSIGTEIFKIYEKTKKLSEDNLFASIESAGTNGLEAAQNHIAQSALEAVGQIGNNEVNSGNPGNSGNTGSQAGAGSQPDQADMSAPQDGSVPAFTPSGGSPYGEHGALRVQGANLVDQNGNPYQLYGMSTHGIAWFPDYVNQGAFQTLRSWNTNCVRLSMYTAEYNGYCTGGNKEDLKNIVKRGVDYATNQGMYVIIDWHVLNDQNPNVYKEEAKAFFAEMSALYKDRSNVLYEICNEPNSSANWPDIKSYAQEVIPIIRANDSDAVIIVGTPNWCQEIDKAAADPLPYDNLLYALHFYAATHKDWLRDRARSCIEGGLPVIISEFGMCDASGNGSNDFNQAGQWMELIRQYNLSYCCWALANKAETCCVINPGCSKTSGWTMEDLSESGRWIVNQFQSE